MKILLTGLTIAIQAGTTFFVLIGVYMVFAFLDNEGGVDGYFALLVFQLIIGAVVAFVTIVVCFLSGLPIRLVQKLNEWWTTYFYVAIIGAVVGGGLLVMSLLPGFLEAATVELDRQMSAKTVPNTLLACTGWILTGFSLLHLYPPKKLTDWIKTLSP